MYIHERRRLHRVSDTEILHWFDISWGRFVSPHDLDRRVVMTRVSPSVTRVERATDWSPPLSWRLTSLGETARVAAALRHNDGAQ